MPWELPKRDSEYTSQLEKFKKKKKRNPNLNFQKFLNKSMRKLICKGRVPEQPQPRPRTVMLSGALDEQALFESVRAMLEKYHNDDLVNGGASQTSRQRMEHLVVRVETVGDGPLDSLEAFLFELIVLRMIRLDGHIRFLPRDTRVKFELSHSQNFRLEERLRVLALVSHCFLEFDLETLDHDESPQSELQTVAAFLRQIDSKGKIKKLRISGVKGVREGCFDSSFKKKVKPQKPRRVKKLLEKYFLRTCEEVGFQKELVTFAHLSMFLRIACREFLSWNLFIGAQRIKDARRVRSIYRSSIRSTLLSIMPFARSIRVQKAAFASLR